MQKKWISIMREDGREIKFRADEVYEVKFGPKYILVYLGDHWDWDIVTREEREKLRTKLQTIK